MQHGISFFLLLIVLGCSGHDSDYVPFVLKGMDAWVYNNETDEEFYGGRATGNYFNKDGVLSECQNLASTTARMHEIEDWSYVCCTVTSSSDCSTKVK